MSGNLFNEIVKNVKKNNDFAFQLEEDNPYEVKEWVDTGCYILNAIMSDGDIYKGIPVGKRIVFSGLEATVKSLLVMLAVNSYIKAKKNVKIIFFETEGSSTVDIAKNMGITSDQMIIIPVVTIEQCRTQMLQILDKIIDTRLGYESKISEKTGKKTRKKIKNFKPIPEEDQENFVFVLDSLGMLGTNKETGDISSGSDTKDMTRAQLIKAMARVVTLKLSLTGSPFFIVNHLYSTFDKYNPYTSSGGSGVKFLADIEFYNTKTKQKEGTEQIGIYLKMKNVKSRFMQENKIVKIPISFKKGLYKYAYLLDLASELGVFKKEGYSWVLPDGVKTTMKNVKENTSKYMNKINLDAIREAIMKDFGFGSKGFIEDENTIYKNDEISNVSDSDDISDEQMGDVIMDE